MISELYAVYGASGYGREVMPLAREQLRKRGIPADRLVFVDDNPQSDRVNGQTVLCYSDFLAAEATARHAVLAIADSVVRENLAARLAADGVQSWTVSAANVVVMDEVRLDDGAILSPFVTLTSNIQIGCHFHANIYSYVAHDCVIGDYVTFAPAVKCNGNVVVKDHAYIGTGAVIRQGRPGQPLVIGRGAVVGMGAVVTKDVPSGTTWGGCPQRSFEKENNLQTSQIHTDLEEEAGRRNKKAAKTDRFSNWQYPEIKNGKPTKYNWVVQHKDNLDLGYKTDIGAFTYINAKYNVIIEDHVQIGSHCAIYSVSTIDDKTGPVVLKKNCRIGTHSTVMPGITVGENAVVGAHSFVNRDVPDGAIAVGVPVRVMTKK